MTSLPLSSHQDPKHTPAPWHLIRCGEKDGSAIATLESRPETMDEPNYWTVGYVNTQRAEWEANARLMAAAPEMLAALRRAVLALAHVSQRNRMYHDDYMAVNAALQKATGES